MGVKATAWETKYYFTILKNLEEAKRDAIPSIIEFHLGELSAIHMHTKSGLMRRRCAKTLAENRSIEAIAL